MSAFVGQVEPARQKVVRCENACDPPKQNFCFQFGQQFVEQNRVPWPREIWKAIAELCGGDGRINFSESNCTGNCVRRCGEIQADRNFIRQRNRKIGDDSSFPRRQHDGKPLFWKMFAEISADGDRETEKLSSSQSTSVHSVDDNGGKRGAFESANGTTREVFTQVAALFKTIGSNF